MPAYPEFKPLGVEDRSEIVTYLAACLPGAPGPPDGIFRV
jgi:hypothetical protein